MMDEKGLAELTNEIMAQGHDETTASFYAVLIGDLPIMDHHGNVLVQDERGQTIATLKPLKSLAE